MPPPVRVRILGVYPFVPTEELFHETLEAHYGSALSGAKLDMARAQTEEHFDGLHVIEIEVDPPGAEFDWCEITQPVAGSPSSNWQVPYDERALDSAGKRWVFFFHFLKRKKPLQTPGGPVPLPRITPLPKRLKHLDYFAP